MSRLLIPKDWEQRELSDIGEVVSGGTPSTKRRNYWGSEVPWITPIDLSGYTRKYIGVGRKGLTRLGLVNSSARLMPKRTVLFSSRAPIGYVAVAENPLATNQGFKSLVPSREISSDFIYFYLKSAKRVAEKNASGTTFKELSGARFSKLPVPVPPKYEQLQIVAIIEQLFSDLDNAIDNLKKAKDQLNVYRQSVLKYAFEGRLTEDWLKQSQLSNPDWRDISIIDIGEIVTGTTPSKKEAKYYGNEYPFYKPGDLDSGYHTNRSIDGLSDAGMKKARLLPAKSVLVTCIGATIGKTGLIRKSGACNQQINAIIPNELTVSEYVYYFAISPWFQDQIKKTSSSTTLPILNKTKFQRLKIKVPSIDEQKQIVKEIESRFSVCDKMEETINNSLEQAEALRQSILKQAFEGKFTEEWRKNNPELISGENSAKALLERIKKEREALKKTKKREK